MGSWVVDIYVWTIIWNFFDHMWPQWPPPERVPYISEKLDFWWSNPQKLASIDYFSASNDQTIRIRNFFWGNWALEAVEASKVEQAAEVNEAAEVSKAWKITTEDFRVIKILEFSFILMFWRISFFWYNHEISYWILATFLSEAVEASQWHFFLKTGWWNTNVQSSWTRYAPLSV